MTITNTMATMKALIQAGVAQPQAETMANLDEQHADDVATHIANRFDLIAAHIEATIERTARDQLKWTLGVTVASVGLGIAILGFMMRLNG